MKDYFIEQVEHEIAELKSLQAKCRKMIRQLPKEKLYADQVKGKVYYKIGQSGNIRRISPKDSRVEKIKARIYYEELERRAISDIQLLENVKREYQSVDPDYCRGQLPKGFQDVPVQFITKLGFLTVDEFRERYQTDQSFRNEQKLHTMSSGEKARSRVEVAIAERYRSRGIDFVYEPCVILKGKVLLHPDYVILVKRKNDVIFHEHVGNMKDEIYRRHFGWKMDQYIKNDLLPMRDVIFTYEKEDGTIDMMELDKLIDTFLL